MLSIERIKAMLKDRNISYVAKATGLSYNTIKDIRDGKATDPRHSTVNTLSDYLESTQ